MNRVRANSLKGQIREPLTFSDQIAFDQFLLAIERNFLLHITTGLNMTVVGLAMFRFFSRNSNDLYEIIGVISFLVAASIVAKGTVDFLSMRRDLAQMEAQIRNLKTSPPEPGSV